MRGLLRIASGLAVISLAAGTFAPAKPAFADDQLTITSFGGSWQTALRKGMFEPFSKLTGVKISEDEYTSQSAKIRAMVESNTVSWDVVDFAADVYLQLCAEGLLETVDWKKLGLDRTKFIGGDTSDCGVPSVIGSTIVAYDKDKLPNGPKTIADVFDTRKFPGKRGLRKDPYYNLEWALVADGVAAKDVYKVLATPQGVNRAFKKLDTIKKDVIWFTSNAQAPQLLADGEVAMVRSTNARIYDAVKDSGKHFEIMWDAQVLELAYWGVPKGTPHKDAADKFLAFAGSPKAQAHLTQYFAYAPANKDAMALVDPAIRPHLPAPDSAGNNISRDAAFWADHGDVLRQRFTAWLAK
ncbi:ABC transporter substrate-binding protein [Bradyrhizobium sp. Pear77]|uniref:ABC transporter substrate-binding protein n=1 Tax=Bradyrhizobium altum TaxID=1571202 RepID=UPI001E533EE3|nr:ABC transporter substrate-binding protein [Bradyrhizobium altum]MCC8960116.1 ABC transporter substrate-binding protein [Bradyrhizobium altum]